MTIPRATIRLQFNCTFTFDDAVANLPYLSALGVSHIYASPILAAEPGSMHGYDVVDPTEINPELGGYAGLSRLASAMRRHDIGMILDIVPNHMAASAANPWWWDVLQWGTGSRYADYFDIDWQDPDPEIRGKLLLPVLGDSLAACLDRNELRLHVDTTSGDFILHYFDHRFPIDPRHYDEILACGGEPWARLAQAFQNWRPDGFIATALQDLPKLRAQLADQLRVSRPQERQDLLAAYDAAFASGRVRLARLIDQQSYRLAHWRDAGTRINWRRFFDINHLVALRIDRAAVFDDYHRLILDLVHDGIIDGVRVDHVDGLADPRAYCRKLRGELRKARPEGADPYLLVEKILESSENLPDGWSVDGTTGYDFMDQVSAVLHNPAGEAALTSLWQRASENDRAFAELARDARREILDRIFPKPLQRVIDLLAAAAPELSRSPSATHTAMVELLAAFHQYRLYGDAAGFAQEDKRLLDEACREAREHLNEGGRTLLDAIAHSLAEPRNAEARSRFQQLSATLTAKAIEDTAFYRYGRLISRNEVGSDPGRLAITPDMFHATCTARHDAFPAAMLATATHDHKRGEDARARLAVLSEILEDWSAFVAMGLRHAAPAKAVQLIIFQSIVGAWPLDLRLDDVEGVGRLQERLAQWLVKALREAKQQTSWDQPDADFERGCLDFLAGLLAPNAPFLADIHRLIERIAPAGAINGLAQTVLRLTAPGVPDLYQGREFWDFSLVDPDNRTPIDFAERSRTLAERKTIPELMSRWRDGGIKQAVIARLLRFRKTEPDLFLNGRYEPLSFPGPRAGHLLGFVRRLEDQALLVIVPRHMAGAAGQDLAIPPSFWGDTRLDLPTGLDIQKSPARDVLGSQTGEMNLARIGLADIFRSLPVAAIHLAG